MTDRKIRIVADSASDTLNVADVIFDVAPLKIITAEKEYTDNKTLDVQGMMDELSKYKGKSSTSCPSAGDWMEAFGEADEILCITITSALSGSYNAAVMAKQNYEETYPERKVYVFDSLSAGPELRLIIEKMKECIIADHSFEQIVEEIQAYQKQTGLLFMLESLQNLANNGRISPLVAKVAGVLGIRLVGKANEQGELEPLEKARGEKKALVSVLDQMKKEGFCGGKVRIAHCLNEDAAQKMRDLVAQEFPNTQIEWYACGGLCSFYAERGGLLIGFEKNMA